MMLGSKKYAWDITICSLIVIIPFLLSLHLLFPDIDGQQSLFLFGFEWRHSFINNRVYIWSILIRIIPLFLLVLWFLSSTYWWRYFIFLPIVPYALAFTEPFIRGDINLYQSVLPVMMFSILLIWLDNKTRKKWKQYPRFNNAQNTLWIKNYKSFYKRLKYKLDKNLTRDSQYETKNYVKKLLNLKSILDQKFIDQNIPVVQSKLTKSAVRSICVLLCFIPALFYLHLLIPKGIKTLDLSLLTITSSGFKDVHTFIWYSNLKICIIFALSIWFVTCRDWWRYSILCPIILFTYQLWEVLKADIRLVDEAEYLESLPSIFLVLGLLFLLSDSVKYQAKIIDIYEELCHEISILIAHYSENNIQLQENILKFNKLREKGNEENNGKHLEQLIHLKEELLKDLRNSSVGYSKT